MAETTRRFWLPGPPVPQARARTGRGFAYYPKPSADYRKWAALQLRTQNAGQPAIWTAVKAGLLFYRVRPKSNKSEWPVVKPDLDNYVKMILDALMDAGILRDDSQVCRIDAGKFWCNPAPTAGPGVDVVLEVL
jgi:Holliday junction resolvase RusA-like endonuclease